MSQEQRNELSEFERALAGLTPRAALDRDRVMFEAGARSVRRGRPVALSAATLVMGLLLGGMAMRSWHNPSPGIAPEIVAQEKVEPVAPPSASSYVVLQRRIISGDFSSPAPIEKTDASSAVEESSLGALRAKWLPRDIAQ